MQHFSHNNYKKSLLYSALALFTPCYALAAGLDYLHPSIDLGGYWSSQGNPQTIGIAHTKGDYFSVTNGDKRNGLVGVGVYSDGLPIESVELSYGLHFFYLAKTSVNGLIAQEKRFTNLSYRYDVTHYPLYVMGRTKLLPEMLPYALNLDVGIGPNFVSTNNFTETALKKNSVPDNAFSGKSTVTFTATAGLSLEFNPVNNISLACGYRFFYLGEGTFNTLSTQIENNLTTGSNYGNAIIISLNFN
jgi:opacity protein-like surface antigen